MDGAPALARWLGTGSAARAAPTFDDLERLPYARMVAEESMRLYPPAYVFSRRADYWTEPDAFTPERFAPGASGKDAADRPKHAYLPFGRGPHICIGNSFAMMEHAIVLAAATRHWRLESIPGHIVRTEPRITLRPRGGLPMRVMRR